MVNGFEGVLLVSYWCVRLPVTTIKKPTTSKLPRPVVAESNFAIPRQDTRAVAFQIASASSSL